MTTIRAVPSTPTDSSAAPDRTATQKQQQITVDPYVASIKDGALDTDAASISNGSNLEKEASKKNRASGEAQRSRFSLVSVPYEKTRKLIGELSIRERTSQSGLSHKTSLGTVNETAASSPASPHFPNIVDAQSSRESFSSVATSPIEESPRNAIGSQIRSSTNQSNQQPGKMHQTSSRLLRMTDDERPYTKDFMDLFSTLMVSLPLSVHRVRFQRVEHSFTSEEAINNLGSLKFSQSNRMPDPKDPSRIVTTTTTTTFSMAKEMARVVCQRFLEARFIEPADGRPAVNFALKGPVWLLTPKGIAVLQRFCQRNGITQRHVIDLIDSNRNTLNLVILERDVASDRLSHDQPTVEVIFRRFAGQSGPNIRAAGESPNPDLLDHYNGLTGVRQAAQRAVGNKVIRNTFTGKGVVDWLMDCTSIIDRRETVELADLFIQHGLMEAVVQDDLFMRENPAAIRYQPTRSALYSLTAKGRRMAGHDKKIDGEEVQKINGTTQTAGVRETNNNRLNAIVNEPSLRLLFREYLRTTLCEENLSFYLEVREFTDSYDQAERAKALTRNDAIRENLAAAYGLYNAYLAPGSPNELNIDHNLRSNLASRMTRAVGDDESMLKSLQDVVSLFKEAQSSVFKLMSSDSVPKFLKDPRFAKQLREQNFEQVIGEQKRGESPPSQAA